MSARDNIGKAKADWKLAIARELGVVVQLSHRGATAVSLKARLLSDRIEQIELGMGIKEVRVVTLEIPVQTGFAYTSSEGEPVTPGDLVTFNEREHAALDPIAKDVTGRVYTLRCVEDKTLTKG